MNSTATETRPPGSVPVGERPAVPAINRSAMDCDPFSRTFLIRLGLVVVGPILIAELAVTWILPLVSSPAILAWAAPAGDVVLLVLLTSWPLWRLVGRPLREAWRKIVAMNSDLLALNETHESLFACRTAPEVAKVLTDALVRRFDAYFARVWLRYPGDICRQCVHAAQCPNKQECLHLVSSSGFYTHLDGPHRRVPLGAFKIGLIAQGRGRTISRDVVNDERIHDRAWARQHGLRTFIGHPLVHKGRVIGVLALFSKADLPDHILETTEILAKLGAAALANVELIDSFHQATRAADAANRGKSDFLANMSHEIRTPMTAILGWSGRLSANIDSEQQRREAAEAICRNGEHLLRIIDDVLDISKIEAGMLRIERIQCAPFQILGDVLSLMRVRAVEKGLSLTAETVGPIPRTIVTDPTRLRQMLLNLTGNAIKFTSHGSVRLTVESVKAGQSAWRLRFAIIDTGIGMTLEQQLRVFEPFVQGDSSTTRLYGGSGLGLAISKRLARMLGGDLTVTSRPNAGCTFQLEIDAGPIVDVETVQGSPEMSLLPAVLSDEPPSRRLQGRILLAEDGLDNRRLFTMFLKDAGAEVVCVGNGQEALEAVLREPFDVVLMDMQMPLLDGYEATSRLRSMGVTTTIIALTAHAMTGDREKCLQAGCTDYLAKPIDEHALLASLAKYMTSSVAESFDLPAAPSVRAAAHGEARLRSKLIDNPRMRPVVEEYVSGLPAVVDDLLEQLGKGDWEALRRQAHAMKGSGGSYGFVEITRAADALERLIRTRESVDRIAESVRELVDLVYSVEGYPAARAVTHELQSPAH